MPSAKRKLSRSGGAQKSARTAAPEPERTEPAPEPSMDMYSDEDMEGGFEDVEDEEAAVQSGDESEGSGDEAPVPSSSAKHDARFAIPSLDEIHGLKETSELYMNNVFKLQLDEMMKQIRPDFDHATALETALRRMHKLFASLPSIEPRPLAQALVALEKTSAVRPPFGEPVPNEETAYKFGFEKPSNLHLVGSWPLKSAARRPGELDVDVEVCMPSSLFQEKDTFNARYFHKRAYYLAVLASAIQNDEKLGMDVAYLDPARDGRSTCLVLRPREPTAKEFHKLKAVIRVHAAHAFGLFPVARLAPNRNSLRGGVAEADAGAALAPTPQYNASLLSDSLRMPHLVFLHATAEACPAFAEACQLLKTWATQRGFGALLLHAASADKYARRRTVAGSENARFMLTMLLAHLLHGDEPSTGLRGRTLHTQRPKLSMGYSSYQLMRGVLDFLAKHPWASQPARMRSQARAGLPPHAEAIPPAAFEKDARVLVEPSGCLNLLAAWPAASVDLLQQEAAQTLHMLNDAEADCFAAVFLQPCTASVTRFDEAATVQLHVHKMDPVLGLDAGSERAYALRHLLDVSAQALATRAYSVAVSYLAEDASWPLDAAAPTPSLGVELGVRLNPDHAWRQVEHGPSPDEPEAGTAFRAFWGELAELRRFRDGRVVESVVWPVKQLDDRAALPRRVLAYALLRHKVISKASKLHFVSQPFTGLLDIVPDLAQRAYLKQPAELGFQPVQAALESLTKQFRAMDDLPLTVIGLQATSQALRSMSTFAPGPLRLTELGSQIPDCASYLPVHDVLLSMESSGQWPDDLAAIQEMKAALYERMAANLDIPGARLRVVYDLDATRGETIQDQSSLVITLPAGFAFACRIHHDRERHLLERLERSASGAARRDAHAARIRCEQRFVHRPAHHAAIQALHDQYPALGTTVRLVQRWFAAQMLSTQVPVEALELLAVAVFTSSAMLAPATGVAGFVRVLALLRDWDARETLLLVPLEAASRRAHDAYAARNDEDRKAPGTTAADLRQTTAAASPVACLPADRLAAEQAFRATRTRDPAVHHTAWCIASDLDTSGRVWTHEAPSVTIADGIRALAGRALALLERPLVRTDTVRMLFTPSLHAYDFVLHMKPAIHTRYAESLHPDPDAWLADGKRAYKNLAAMRPTVYGSEARPDWDPVNEYVHLLQTLYPGVFRLFYDQHGGSAVGGIWERGPQTPQPFKVMLGYSTTPTSKDQVVLNTTAVLSELQRLGHGLVDRIEVASAT